MEKFRVRDLVMIRTRTTAGEKQFAAIVTNIERVYSDPDGVIEWVFGYEPLDPAYGSHGAGRIPRRGEYGTIDVKVVASGMLTRSERWNGGRHEQAG